MGSVDRFCRLALRADLAIRRAEINPGNTLCITEMQGGHYFEWRDHAGEIVCSGWADGGEESARSMAVEALRRVQRGTWTEVG